MRVAMLLMLLPWPALAQVCLADAECGERQLCTAKPQLELTCHRRCEPGCGAAERCTVLRPPDDERWPKSRRRYVCTEEAKRLCRPCETDADCDGFLDHCLFQMNGEKACGRDCSWDDQCPRGYRCADPGGVDGREVRRQCIPEAGCCNCDQGFFVPAARPPEARATGTAGPGGAAAVPAPAPPPSAHPPVPRPGARGNAWRSPTAGAPSMVPVSQQPPRGAPPSGTAGSSLPGVPPSSGTTPRASPTSPHTTAGSLPAPRPGGAGTSATPRPNPTPVGADVVR